MFAILECFQSETGLILKGFKTRINCKKQQRENVGVTEDRGDSRRIAVELERFVGKEFKIEREGNHCVFEAQEQEKGKEQRKLKRKDDKIGGRERGNEIRVKSEIYEMSRENKANSERK